MQELFDPMRCKGHWVTVPFSKSNAGLIDVVQLKNELETAVNKTNGLGASGHITITPNLFAVEMIEGVGKVRLVRQQ